MSGSQDTFTFVLKVVGIWSGSAISKTVMVLCLLTALQLLTSQAAARAHE